MAKRGPKTKFTEKLGKEICLRLANGETLRAVCRSLGIPESNVRFWVIEDAGPGFAAQYARARDVGMDVVADEIMDIADSAQDAIVGNDKSDNARIQARKLMVDARRWYLSKLAPKRYGDKPIVDSQSADEAMKQLAEAIRNSPTE